MFNTGDIYFAMFFSVFYSCNIFYIVTDFLKKKLYLAVPWYGLLLYTL